MSIDVQRFDESEAKTWDDFVAKSRNGTLFHTRRFLAYHSADRFEDHSLIFTKNAKTMAVLPAAVRSEKKNTILASHPGASYGGLVLSADCSVKDTGEIIDALISHAKKQKFSALSFLRLTPQSVRSQWSDDQEYWLYQRGATLARLEMDGSVLLENLTPETLLTSFDGKCRNMVRQAERSGLTVKVSDDFEAFWKILEATLSARHAAHPTHTAEEIVRLKKLVGDNLRLFAAFDGKTMVGGIVVVTLNDRALYTLYIAQNYDYQKHHPVHLILTEIMRFAIAEHRQVLHLGVSTEDGGKKVNEGLFFFKESFGMRPVRRESWEIVL